MASNLLGFVSMLALVLMAVLADAEAPGPADDAPSASAFSNRLRLGVGSFQGVDTFKTSLSQLNVGIVGLHLRIGTQLTERFGIELEGAGNTSGFTLTGRGAVLGSYTLNDFFSLATGAVVGANHQQGLGILGPAPEGQNVFAGWLVRLQLHFITSRDGSGGRKALAFGLEGEVGGVVSGTPAAAGYGVFLTCGFAYW